MYAMWFARTLAMRTAPTLLRAVPQFIIAFLLVPAPYAMTAPTPGGLIAWFAAVFCATLLSTAITNLMHALTFVTIRAEGLVRFFPTLVLFFSGMIVPLRLMPDRIQFFVRFQPFAGLMDLPSQLFCGSLAPESAWWIVPTQLAWVAIFVLAGRALMKSGIRRVRVAGG
jgi:ABC-2 type transport system permease protein